MPSRSAALARFSGCTDATPRAGPAAAGGASELAWSAGWAGSLDGPAEVDGPGAGDTGAEDAVAGGVLGCDGLDGGAGNAAPDSANTPPIPPEAGTPEAGPPGPVPGGGELTGGESGPAERVDGVSNALHGVPAVAACASATAFESYGRSGVCRVPGASAAGGMVGGAAGGAAGGIVGGAVGDVEGGVAGPAPGGVLEGEPQPCAKLSHGELCGPPLPVGAPPMGGADGDGLGVCCSGESPGEAAGTPCDGSEDDVCDPPDGPGYTPPYGCGVRSGKVKPPTVGIGVPGGRSPSDSPLAASSDPDSELAPTVGAGSWVRSPSASGAGCSSADASAAGSSSLGISKPGQIAAPSPGIGGGLYASGRSSGSEGCGIGVPTGGRSGSSVVTPSTGPGSGCWPDDGGSPALESGGPAFGSDDRPPLDSGGCPPLGGSVEPLSAMSAGDSGAGGLSHCRGGGH